MLPFSHSRHGAPNLAMGKYIFILFRSLTISISLWTAISNAKNVFPCPQRNRTLLIWVRSGRSNPFIPGQSKHEPRKHEGTTGKRSRIRKSQATMTQQPGEIREALNSSSFRKCTRSETTAKLFANWTLYNLINCLLPVLSWEALT